MENRNNDQSFVGSRKNSYLPENMAMRYEGGKRVPFPPPFSYLSTQNAHSWGFDGGERRMALLLELFYKE